MDLYPFQREAVDKLWRYTSVLVGDEMGLGKTVEAIALDTRRRRHHNAPTTAKTLVIAPLSVLSSWEDHFKSFSPDLKVKVIDPKVRHSLLYALRKNTATVFIVHWESLRLMPELQEVKWFHIIGDEIHRIKNRDAQQTLALKKLRTAYKTGLSGTPADNKPDDFWSVLNWLYPKRFSSYWRFYNKHVLFKEEVKVTGDGRVIKYRKIIGTAAAEELQAEISPYFLRRLKKNVIQDLPDKYHTELHVELDPRQRRAYNDMRDRMLAWIGEHEAEPVAAPVVIAQLLRLQQFACAYAELVRVQRKGEWIDALRLTDPSSKLDAVEELIGGTDEQIVVFGQSKQVINLLEARLKRGKVPTCCLTGDTPQEVRGELVADFQRGRYKVFAGTISAGGIGITLTAASTVVFIDRAWNPSKNLQAEDRLHRIGQKSAVQVVTVVADNTLDAERNETIELKWDWIRQMLGDK